MLVVKSKKIVKLKVAYNNQLLSQTNTNMRQTVLPTTLPYAQTFSRFATVPLTKLISISTLGGPSKLLAEFDLWSTAGYRLCREELLVEAATGVQGR